PRAPARLGPPRPPRPAGPPPPPPPPRPQRPRQLLPRAPALRQALVLPGQARRPRPLHGPRPAPPAVPIPGVERKPLGQGQRQERLGLHLHRRDLPPVAM